MFALRSLRSFAALLATAVLGGVVAVGAVALLGGLEGDTTVVTETVDSPNPSVPAGRGMTVNEIYRRASSGVVRINATSNLTAADPNLADPFQSPVPSVPSSSALGSGLVIDKAGHLVKN